VIKRPTARTARIVFAQVSSISRRYVRTRGHLPKLNDFTISQIPLMPGSCAPQNARIKLQFTGIGGLRTYINFTHIEQRIAQNMNVHAQTKNRRDDLIPVIVTVIVAVVGTAGILNNLRPGNDSQDSDKARMITSAAVSRAGAIEIPSEPPADRRHEGS
jgi:hypothetical protein